MLLESTPSELNDPELYINRELSLLEFNRRVLAQATDTRTPLLERLRFLTICSTNLDEFFEIRVAGLKQQIAYGLSQSGPDGLTPGDTIRRVSRVAHELVDEQYRVLEEDLVPELKREGIRILERSTWRPKLKRWVEDYFREQVVPVLTPMGLDPGHPFPRVVNKSLNFIVSLEGDDAFGRDIGIAVVPVPRALPRLIHLPPEVAKRDHDFVTLSAVISAHVSEVFPGMTVTGCHAFRVTRNSDLWVDEEEVDDLLHALKGELPARNFGAAVRLEVDEEITESLTEVLCSNFDLTAEDVYRVSGPVNLHRFVAVYNKVDRADLKYPPFRPGSPRGLGNPGVDVFEVVRRGDVLLHHPYESFAPVIELVRQAAQDPNVLAIKQTLYRSGEESPLVDSLLEAAQAGKEVTVVVELRARFDEAANIDLATRLQEAGAKVVYGIVGYKTHSKMLMVVRREGRRLRRYVHLGTGNYHLGTARAYTDLGLLTCEPSIGDDVHHLFLQLTGLGRAVPLNKIVQSPFTLERTLLDLIQGEIENASKGKEARIVARMNSLLAPRLIRSLYAASKEGVKVDLIVRGACALRPGLPGISDNIRVRSIVGRFLEHSRVFYFWAGGEALTYCSSADWMPRNLYRRVETCFPIDDRALRARVIEEALTLPLEDNSQAWLLQPDGSYVATEAGDATPVESQSVLLGRLGLV